MRQSAGTGENDLFYFERLAREAGHMRIAGIDEVGRGPLAGPVVAAAVVLPDTNVTLALADSKVLTARRREHLAAELRNLAGVQIGIGTCSASEVDALNVLRASVEAMRKAVAALQPHPSFALVDGLPIHEFPVAAKFIVKGDGRSASIAAASIIAKVHRDALMVAMDADYPGYGFAQHKGYATALHLQALQRLGPTPEHRHSYAPVWKAAGNGGQQLDLGLFSE